MNLDLTLHNLSVINWSGLPPTAYRICGPNQHVYYFVSLFTDPFMDLSGQYQILQMDRLIWVFIILTPLLVFVSAFFWLQLLLPLSVAQLSFHFVTFYLSKRLGWLVELQLSPKVPFHSHGASRCLHTFEEINGILMIVVSGGLKISCLLNGFSCTNNTCHIALKLPQFLLYTISTLGQPLKSYIRLLLTVLP